jgi:hypothetical protein
MGWDVGQGVRKLSGSEPLANWRRYDVSDSGMRRCALPVGALSPRDEARDEKANASVLCGAGP